MRFRSLITTVQAYKPVTNAVYRYYAERRKTFKRVAEIRNETEKSLSVSVFETLAAEHELSPAEILEIMSGK